MGMKINVMDGHIKVGLAQIAPVWLDKESTKEKIRSYIEDAAKENCHLVTFGEGILPGYPFWLGLTGGAEFNSDMQKEIHAHYIQNAVAIGDGELDDICDIAREKSIAVYLGTIERATDRGGHSLYASLVYIDQKGVIRSVHRKLRPTYEERLAWSPGDGHGLQVHKLGPFTVGGLNCWENWMPMPRMALYGMGEDLHVAVWPGSYRNTHDITRFMAKEGRSYVISVSGLMRSLDFPPSTPYLEDILKTAPEFLTDGGSCLAGPEGEWIIEPVVDKECLLSAEIDIKNVWKERQNFDVAGHYSRPDVFQLKVDRRRQSTISFQDIDNPINE